jgi:hypothetical protein
LPKSSELWIGAFARQQVKRSLRRQMRCRRRASLLPVRYTRSTTSSSLIGPRSYASRSSNPASCVPCESGKDDPVGRISIALEDLRLPLAIRPPTDCLSLSFNRGGNDRAASLHATGVAILVVPTAPRCHGEQDKGPLRRAATSLLDSTAAPSKHASRYLRVAMGKTIAKPPIGTIQMGCRYSRSIHST